MATLIQSKQIEGIVTASAVDGDFSVSGSLIVSGSGIFTQNITASGVVSANRFVGDGSQLTGVVATGTGVSLESGSVLSTITKFEFSGSGIDLNIVNVNTASIYSKTPYEFGGLFRTYNTLTELNSVSTSFFSQGQIVYIIDSNSLYQADITYADFVTTFTDSVTWNSFVFEAGASAVANGDGLSKTYESGVTTLSLNTGSAHFTSAVEYIISSGSYMIDAGLI